MKTLKVLLLGLAAASAVAQQSVEIVKVVAKPVQRKLQLPGELRPYESVDLRAKVSAYVEKVNADKGSAVRVGDVLAQLVSPELAAQRAEVEAKLLAMEADAIEAEARVVGVESTYSRLSEAAKTPGAVAENDLVQARKDLTAARAFVDSKKSSVAAARKSVEALKQLEDYLIVDAPFDGVITERFVHPGTLVGPSAGAPLFRLEQLSRLRLVVAVPETAVGGIPKGVKASFKVPAFPGQEFFGIIARIPNSLDAKTRSMPVELDVNNSGAKLAPGMYAEVTWPVHKQQPSLLIPPSAVVTNTERTFVIRMRNGKAEWVNVSRGAPVADLIEVFGALAPGDDLVRRGTDELREGTALKAAQAAK
jgi:membrane fusion protein, multidrug efflux system